MAEAVAIGKYCQSVAESAVHYSSKQTEWTPNNIRRLILSPDGVIVQLHTSKNLVKRTFNPTQYNQCIYDPKYKSMVSVLGSSGNNVCSHVEEIVYCLQGVQGGQLNSNEANLTSIVASGKGSANEEQLKKVIGERFKRLYAIVYYEGSVNQLMQEFGNKLVNPEWHIGEEYKGGSVVLIHESDWFKGTFLRPATYQADAPNGHLATHLAKLRSTMENKIATANKDRIRSERYGELETKLDKELKYLKQVFFTNSQVFKMLSSEKSRSVAVSALGVDYSNDLRALVDLHSVTICDALEGFDKGSLKESMIKYGATFPKIGSQDKKAAAEQEVTAVHGLTITLYAKLFALYSNFFNSLNQRYPLLVKTYFSDCDMRIKQVQGGLRTGVSCEDATIPTSLVNIGCQLMGLLLTDSIKNKYSAKEFWTEWTEKAVNR